MDVFISYHRGNDGSAIAQLIELKLKMLGYSVFLDYNSLKKGEFDQQILRRIRSAKAFLLICTPTALNNCMRPDSWVRWEIRQALESGVPIIPILMDGFRWDSVALPADINSVRYHHGINLDFEYIDPGIDRLCHLMDFAPEGQPSAQISSGKRNQEATSVRTSANRTSSAARRSRSNVKATGSRYAHSMKNRHSRSVFLIICVLVCALAVYFCFFVMPRSDARSYQPKSSAEWERVKTALAFGASIKDHTYPFRPEALDYWAFGAAEEGLLEITVQRSEGEQTNDLLLVLLNEHQQVLNQTIIPKDQIYASVHWQIDKGYQLLHLKLLDSPVHEQKLQIHFNFNGEELPMPRGAVNSSFFVL